MLEEKDIKILQENVEKSKGAQAAVFCWINEKGEGAIIPLGDVKTIFMLKEQLDVMVRDRFLRPTVRIPQGVNLGLAKPQEN